MDPVDPQNLEKTPQKKVYEPSWLAGTSVGDVMFQADYFLKELALGEYSMPASDSVAIAYGTWALNGCDLPVHISSAQRVMLKCVCIVLQYVVARSDIIAVG